MCIGKRTFAVLVIFDSDMRSSRSLRSRKAPCMSSLIAAMVSI